MISIPEAQATVLAHTPVLGIEAVPLAEAVGRTLARGVTARDSLPPFPASIKVRSLFAVCGRAGRHTWQFVGCLWSADASASPPPPQLRPPPPLETNPPQDGYAVVSADGVGDYPVAGESRPGALPEAPLTPGAVYYITTGGRVGGRDHGSMGADGSIHAIAHT
jgi:gephyrin